jgi:2-iminobutanoate/2-iminopropanoate deaminase
MSLKGSQFMSEVLNTSKAPAAIGPYSQGIKTNGLVFISGQLAINPADGSMVGEDFASQTRQSIENIKAILESAGMTLSNVVKATVYLTDMSQFSTVNSVYGEYFKEKAPARVAVEVSKLPKNALVEIDAIAAE